MNSFLPQPTTDPSEQSNEATRRTLSTSPVS